MKTYKQLEIPFKENVKNLYWHPYELRHYFRDYYSFNFKSYNRLGKILNSYGLCLPNYKKPSENELSKILDIIALHIPMNLKLFKNSTYWILDSNKTLKEIYKDRKNFRIALNELCSI